jgi:hypothetical protein
LSHSTALSIGSAESSHVTVRPALLRTINPASLSTSRCFITAASVISNGSASSLMDARSNAFSRVSTARRVGSASAANMRSSCRS